MARILIVDDDNDILKFTDALLTQSGHDVRTATEVLMGMKLLRSAHFDLLITDANMPQYTGFEFIRTLRSEPKFANLPVIMLTGLRERAHIEKAIKVGVNDYIVKPIDAVIFLKKIEETLTKQPLRKELEVALDTSTLSKAIAGVEIEVTSVSEYGMKANVNFEIPLGQLLHLHCDILKPLGLENTPVRVIKSKKVNESWELVVGFVGIDQNKESALREWLESHQHRRPVKVS